MRLLSAIEAKLFYIDDRLKSFKIVLRKIYARKEI